MKKRVRAVIAAACTAGVMLTGCRSQETVQTPEPEEITMVHYMGEGNARDVLEEFTQKFNASQDEIRVNMRYIPTEDFRKEMALKIADGNAPDIMLTDCADVAYFNDMHPLVELSQVMSDSGLFMEQALESCMIDEKIKGLPLWMNCSLLYYNKKMLKDAGVSVPRTPEEFAQAAQKLTTGGCYGVSISILREETISYCLLPFLWGKGIGVDNLDTEEARSVYETFHQLAHIDALSDQSINMSDDDATHQFGMGNAAMMLNSSAYIEMLQTNHPQLDFGVAAMPTGGGQYSVVGGEVLAAFEGEKQEEALEFIRFVMEKKGMGKDMEKTGLFSPRSDIFQEQYPGNKTEEDAKEIFEHATAREYSADWPQISHVLTLALRDTISGQRDTGEVLAQAAKEIRSIRGEE